MRGLNNLELLVHFGLSPGVAIWMVLECCNRSVEVGLTWLGVVTELPELLLDILDVGRGIQLQVCIVVSGCCHGSWVREGAESLARSVTLQKRWFRFRQQSFGLRLKERRWFEAFA